MDLNDKCRTHWGQYSRAVVLLAASGVRERMEAEELHKLESR